MDILDDLCIAEKQTAGIDDANKDVEKDYNIQQSQQVEMNSSSKEPKAMTCEELRSRLKGFGLKTSGNKAMLTARYLETLNKENPTTESIVDGESTPENSGDTKAMSEPTASDHPSIDVAENTEIGKKRKNDEDLEVIAKVSKLDHVCANGVIYEKSKEDMADIESKEPSKENEGSRSLGGVSHMIAPKKMNVSQLKSSLGSRGLNTDGQKKVLMKRLVDAITAENESKQKELMEFVGKKDDETIDIVEPFQRTSVEESLIHEQIKGNHKVMKTKNDEELKAVYISNDIQAKSMENKDIEIINPHNMRVSQLKSSLASLGLSTSGLKAVLTKRLVDAQDLKNRTDEKDRYEFDVEKRGNVAHFEGALKEDGLVKNVGVLTEAIDKEASGEVALPDGATKEDGLVSTAKTVKSGREVKCISHTQYSDMIEELPFGSYDFDEEPVLVMNSSNLNNGVNFHIPKSVLAEPAIPKDVLSKILLQSGLRKNEIAITCGLSAEKAFNHKKGKEGTGTQFLKEIDPHFVNSEGMPNIIKTKGKPVRDAFTYTLPHATFASAYEVGATMLRLTKSRDLRDVLNDIVNSNKTMEEGHNRAVVLGIKYAIDEDLQNKNDEENNSTDNSFEDEDTDDKDYVVQETDEEIQLREKLLEIVKVNPISQADLFEQVRFDESCEIEEGDLEQAVDTILTLDLAIYNKETRKLEYVNGS